jgi:hypothetical protein
MTQCEAAQPVTEYCSVGISHRGGPVKGCFKEFTSIFEWRQILEILTQAAVDTVNESGVKEW